MLAGSSPIPRSPALFRQSSAVVQPFAILVFPVLQILPLSKTGVPHSILTQAACDTPSAAMSFSGALPPHKAGFSPFALTVVFLNPKASPASFTKQGGKWKNRVSHPLGKGLSSVFHPTLRWCHPVLGPGVSGGGCTCQSRMHDATVLLISLAHSWV